MSSATASRPLNGFSIHLEIGGQLTLLAVEVGPEGPSALLVACKEGEWFRLQPTPDGMYVQRFAKRQHPARQDRLNREARGPHPHSWIRTENDAIEPYVLSAHGAKQFLDEYQHDVIGLLVEANPSKLVPLEPPRPSALGARQN